jgi:hypothetical protein
MAFKETVVHNFRYCHRIWPEGLSKTPQNLSKNNRSPGQDLNSGPPEYVAGMLITQPWRLCFPTWLQQFIDNVATGYKNLSVAIL